MNMQKPHNIPLDNLSNAFSSNAKQGLTADAERRIEQYGRNCIQSAKWKHSLKLFLSQFARSNGGVCDIMQAVSKQFNC